jgi:hypothetical protein
MAAALPSVSVTISQGQSLSDIADLSAGNLVAVIAPDQWEYAAGLTFQVSNDGMNFNDLFLQGYELITLPITPGVANVVSVNFDLGWVPYLKLRSGTRQNPVPQSADRIFTLILQK